MRRLFSDIPKLAYVLAAGSVVEFVRIALSLGWFSISRKLWWRDKAYQFTFRYFGKEQRIYLWNNVDLSALLEIYVIGEYEITLGNNPKYVIDVGAHTGNTSLYFASQYQEAQVFAIEASPENFLKLQQNVQAIKNITPIFGAVSNVDGEIRFYESSSSISSSVTRRSEADKEVLVPCFTLESFLAQNNIARADLIKIDIEGAEEFLFDTSRPESLSQDYIIEIHADLMNSSKESLVKKFENMQTTLHEVNSNRSLLRAHAS